MNNIKIEPLNGKSFVELESSWGEEAGGIIVPQELRRIRALCGKVIATNMTDRCRRICGVDSLLDSRVILKPGQGTHVRDNVYSFPNTYCLDIHAKKKRYAATFLAIIPEGADFGHADQGIRRCKFCGPAKPGSPNMIMVHDSERGVYCPRCFRTEKGDQLKRPGKVDMSVLD